MIDLRWSAKSRLFGVKSQLMEGANRLKRGPKKPKAKSPLLVKARVVQGWLNHRINQMATLHLHLHLLLPLYPQTGNPPAPPSLELEAQQTIPILTPEQKKWRLGLVAGPTTAWSDKERKAWAKIAKPIEPDDWKAVRWFYTQSGCQYLRRDLLTLLNNWSGEIDRAKTLTRLRNDPHDRRTSGFP